MIPSAKVIPFPVARQQESVRCYGTPVPLMPMTFGRKRLGRQVEIRCETMWRVIAADLIVNVRPDPIMEELRFDRWRRP